MSQIYFIFKIRFDIFFRLENCQRKLWWNLFIILVLYHVQGESFVVCMFLLSNNWFIIFCAFIICVYMYYASISFLLSNESFKPNNNERSKFSAEIRFLWGRKMNLEWLNTLSMAAEADSVVLKLSTMNKTKLFFHQFFPLL